VSQYVIVECWQSRDIAGVGGSWSIETVAACFLSPCSVLGLASVTLLFFTARVSSPLPCHSPASSEKHSFINPQLHGGPGLCVPLYKCAQDGRSRGEATEGPVWGSTASTLSLPLLCRVA
jgi:hypothetical protein